MAVLALRLTLGRYSALLPHLVADVRGQVLEARGLAQLEARKGSFSARSVHAYAIVAKIGFVQNNKHR